MQENFSASTLYTFHVIVASIEASFKFQTIALNVCLKNCIFQRLQFSRAYDQWNRHVWRMWPYIWAEILSFNTLAVSSNANLANMTLKLDSIDRQLQRGNFGTACVNRTREDIIHQNQCIVLSFMVLNLFHINVSNITHRTMGKVAMQPLLHGSSSKGGIDANETLHNFLKPVYKYIDGRRDGLY